jgi:RNA polymerase sigma factor (sigma-70 family)
MRSAEPTPILPKPERDALVTKHLRYAERYAARIMRIACMGEHEDDIRSEAHLGLVEAALRFDPAVGVRFGTYAAHWVRKQVGDFIDQNKRSVRRSKAHDVRAVAPRIAGSIRRLQHVLGRLPTTEEIAEDTDSTVSAVERAQTAFRGRDIPVSTSGEYEIGSRVVANHDAYERPETPEEIYTQLELCERIEEALSVFSERDASILRERLAGEAMLEEVGDAHGISRERVRQVQEAQTPRLRRRLLEVGKEWAA